MAAATLTFLPCFSLLGALVGLSVLGACSVVSGVFASGVVVLTSVSLAWFHHPYWLGLTAFAGLNLLQSAFTNWCPMVWLLARAGLKPCVAVAK